MPPSKKISDDEMHSAAIRKLKTGETWEQIAKDYPDISASTMSRRGRVVLSQCRKSLAVSSQPVFKVDV